MVLGRGGEGLENFSTTGIGNDEEGELEMIFFSPFACQPFTLPGRPLQANFSSLPLFIGGDRGNRVYIISVWSA